MLLQITLIFSLTIALVLFIIALSINAWPCGGLFESCQSANATAEGITYDYHVIGGLLIAAAITAAIGLVFSMCLLRKPRTWVVLACAFWTLTAFAMGIAAEIYFYMRTGHDWLMLLAAVAMALSLTSFTINLELVYDLRSSPINWFTPVCY